MATSEGSGQPAHRHSLTKAFAVRRHVAEILRKLQAKKKHVFSPNRGLRTHLKNRKLENYKVSLFLALAYMLITLLIFVLYYPFTMPTRKSFQDVIVCLFVCICITCTVFFYFSTFTMYTYKIKHKAFFDSGCRILLSCCDWPLKAFKQKYPSEMTS